MAIFGATLDQEYLLPYKQTEFPPRPSPKKSTPTYAAFQQKLKSDPQLRRFSNVLDFVVWRIYTNF